MRIPKDIHRVPRAVLVSNNRHIRRVKRIVRHPLFTVPTATFMVLLALGAVGIISISGGKPNFRPSDTYVVIVTHDGVQQTVPTRAPTVGVLLSRLNIKLNPGDVVEPSESTPIVEQDFRINVYRAVPVEIVDGTQHTFTYSAAATPRAIVQQAGINIYPEDYVSVIPTQNFLTDDAIGERVVIDPATPVNVNLYGTPTVIRTHAKTVGALLADEKIKLGANDSVEPDPATLITADASVFLIRKGTQIITQPQVIPTPIQNVDDSTLTSGSTAVEQQGSPGQELLTYQVNYQNGKEVSQQLIQTVVTQQPVTQIIKVGTAPLAVLLQAWLYKLRMCESGGNYQEDTGNGFYGAYQFTADTWDKWDTGYAYANLAPPQVQDATIIENTNASADGLASQNPGCYIKEGLSAFPPPND